MFHSRYLSVLEAKTRREFEAQVVHFADWLGFDRVTAMVVVDSPTGSSEFISVGLVPQAYRARHEDRSSGPSDPVMQHCKTQSVPLVWNQATYVSAGRGEKWEHQAQFGYRFGISVAMHLPGGLHFSYGAARSNPLADDPEEVSRMTAALQLGFGPIPE